MLEPVQCSPPADCWRCHYEPTDEHSHGAQRAELADFIECSSSDHRSPCSATFPVDAPALKPRLVASRPVRPFVRDSRMGQSGTSVRHRRWHGDQGNGRRAGGRRSDAVSLGTGASNATLLPGAPGWLYVRLRRPHSRGALTGGDTRSQPRRMPTASAAAGSRRRLVRGQTRRRGLPGSDGSHHRCRPARRCSSRRPVDVRPAVRSLPRTCCASWSICRRPASSSPNGGRELVGGAVLALRPSVRAGGYVGTIDLLIVDPGHDAASVTNALLEELLRSARNKGCAVVEAALPNDPGERARWDDRASPSAARS